MYKFKILFICLGVFFGVFLTSCVRVDEFPIGQKLECDAENLNKNGKKYIEKSEADVLFDGGKLQTEIDAHSGKHSVLTSAKGKFAFGYSIKHAGPDWYFKVSVRRKSKHGGGLLVASANDSKRLYTVSANVYETDDKGWERLELDVFTPTDYRGEKLTFYVWNSTQDTVFFDDMKIERFRTKTYPSYKMENLSVHLDTSSYLKIQKKREDAFKKGILQSADDDWVKGIISDENDMMKAKLRLKGDWLDHLRGQKWSYRIKLKKKYAWHRMKTFSIQTPSARGYLYEWVTHQIFDAQDILTTRYGFVTVSLNNRSLGLYSWEEHFEKQLLEWRNRREGPILKFSEDAFWQTNFVSAKKNTGHRLPYYRASVIEPFRQGKTVESASLYGQFLSAQKLMQQYKSHSMSTSDIFDTDKLAKTYAMLDITHARHGRAWHNQRYYFNPVICKLERIAFDGFGEKMVPVYGLANNSVFKTLKGKVEGEEHSLIAFVFKDSVFTNRYLHYLETFSSEEFIDKAISKMSNEIHYYDSILKFEFPYYQFDSTYLSKSAKDIRAYLPKLRLVIDDFQKEELRVFAKNNVLEDVVIIDNTPEFFVNVYQQKKEGDSLFIEIQNYYPNNIIILGTGKKHKYVEFFEHPEPRIKSYNRELQALTMITDTASKFLFFMVEGHDATFKTEIYPWPYPSGKTPQQELMTYVNLEDTIFIEKVEGNDIFVKKGNIKINYPIIIPEGYKVYFSAGTTIDLVNSAMFISYSPVFMKGTIENPIVITSSDFSANGFTVLQAKGSSKIDNVIFENLNTLDYKGWILTGAVNFYESDVKITNTKFYRNQCEDALNIIRSDFTLKNSSFDYILSDAFDSDFSKGSVLSTVFTNIGNDAIDFSGSDILIDNTQIYDVQDKGISGGEDSKLTVSNCIIERANIGIASKDLSTVTVESSKVEDCNYGIVLLQKKPEYGPAKMLLNNVEFSNMKTKFLIEEGSVIIENGKEIKGKEKNVALRFY